MARSIKSQLVMQADGHVVYKPVDGTRPRELGRVRVEALRQRYPYKELASSLKEEEDVA